MSYVYRVIALFCIGWAIVYADRTTLYPMLPVIGDEFRLSATQTGAITSAYFLAYVLMQIPAGFLADRLGPKRVLVVMYGLAGLGLLAIGLLAQSYTTLLLFAALYGLGAGAYYSTGYSTVMNTVPQHLRGLSSAIINSGMSVGLALGLTMAGPIYLATANWRLPFLILAVPTLALALTYALALRDVRPAQPSPSNPDCAGSAQASRNPWPRILRDRHLMSLNVAAFCSLYGFWVVVTWGPSFFLTERGVGLGVAGFYTGLIALAAIPAALVAGRLSDRLGRKRISLLLFPGAALTIFALAWVRSVWALVIVLLCYGLLGKLAWDPVAIAWLSDHVTARKPDILGTAIGVFSFSAMASSVVAPLVSGWIKDVTGSLVWAFYLGGVVVLVGFLVALLAGETINS